MTTKITYQKIVSALEEMSSNELDKILAAAEMLYRERQLDYSKDWDDTAPVVNYTRDI